jgi:hypothetical protein
VLHGFSKFEKKISLQLFAKLIALAGEDGIAEMQLSSVKNYPD